jgi:DNA repair protein RecO (recombination protein O)
MDIKTKGIVLHTVKYSETSVIVKIYTEKLGLVSYIVNGVRSAKSTAKASMMRPLTQRVPQGVYV